MSETAFKAAFKRAGIDPAEERLREITLRAMVKHADNTFATADAIWGEVQRDVRLMAKLFEHGWRREVSALMHRVRNDIAGADSTGALARPIERKAAKVVQLIRAQDEAEAAKQHRAEAECQANADREHAEHLHAVQQAWKHSRVGRIEINNAPIWENTAGTVRSWLATQHRQMRTVEALIAGLPDDGRPISYYRKPSDVESLWQQAGAVNG